MRRYDLTKIKANTNTNTTMTMTMTKAKTFGEHPPRASAETFDQSDKIT